MLISRPVYNVRVEINTFLTDESSKKPHTLYRIDVRTSNRSYFVDKRFKEFEILHNELKKRLQTDKSSSVQVNALNDLFPNRHLYTKTTKSIESRRISLDLYMRSVVEFFDDKLPNEIVKFLRLDESVSNTNDYTSTPADAEESFSPASNTTLAVIGVNDISLVDVLKSKSSARGDIVLAGVLATFYQ